MSYVSEDLEKAIRENKRLREELKNAKEEIDIQKELIEGYKKRKAEYQKIIITKAVTLRKVSKEKNIQEETDEEEECL